jgi:hypothetical protein
VIQQLSFPEIDAHSKGEKSFVGRRREGWATIIFDSKFKKAGNALDSVDIFLYERLEGKVLLVLL